MNGIGEDIGATVMMGKVIRPLRSVDPSQTEYQGLIEITEEGWCQAIMELVDLTFKVHCFLGKIGMMSTLLALWLFQVEVKARITPLESWV